CYRDWSSDVCSSDLTNWGEYRRSACLNSTGPLTLAPSHNSDDASIGTPPSPPCLVRHFPSASKFSSAKPIGSMSLWQLAQGSFRSEERRVGKECRSC